MENNSFDFVYECGCDIELASEKARELDALIEKEAARLAKQKAGETIAAQKDELRLQIIKEINDSYIHNRSSEISRSSPYIYEKFVVKGKELNIWDFMNVVYRRNRLYEDAQLIYNDYCDEYQLMYKNGKRKFVSEFVVVAWVVVNATGPGKCKAIAVYLKGYDSPIIFYEGDINPTVLKRQTRFYNKGLNVSNDVIFASFLQAMKACSNGFFLIIPEHSGIIKLEGGNINYTSALSIIPGFEEMYPDEIKAHQLIQHEVCFDEVVMQYLTIIPQSWKFKLAVVIRVMSILLPFFEELGLKSDRLFVISPKTKAEKETVIALTKRYNYSSTVVTSLSDRITKIRNALDTGNDITVVFSYFSDSTDERAFDNGIREICLALSDENGNEAPTRKIVILITDLPGSISEECKAYYISITDELENVDAHNLQHLSGMLDYSLIQYLVKNPDASNKVINKAISDANKLLNSNCDIECESTAIMVISTAFILMEFGLVNESEINAILNWLRTEATLRMTLEDTYCKWFRKAVSDAIMSGELVIANQHKPPHYVENGHTAFIAEKDNSINISDEVLQKVIMPKIPARISKVRMNNYLNSKGWLIGKHSKKRLLNVKYSNGISDDVEVYSYRRSLLEVRAKAYIDDILDREFWFRVGEFPDGFIPCLYNTGKTKAAGYIFTSDMDINRHKAISGKSRIGKTHNLSHEALSRVCYEGEDAVIIFDLSDGFNPSEFQKHIGDKCVRDNVAFWNVYRDGLPVDILDLRGCLTYKEKKERLTRLYAIAVRSLGSYEETILKSAVKKMIKDIEANHPVEITDIVTYISEDNHNDEAHQRLIFKMDAILDDFSGTPNTRYNWKEFVEVQDKRIIVISTGKDNTGKNSAVIDVLLESLYQYKQMFPSLHYTVILDEVQKLYLHENGTINNLLCTSGKHGLSLIIASQNFPIPKTPFGEIAGNCGRIRGYCPEVDDITCYSAFFKCDEADAASLERGFCYEYGDFYSRYRCKNVPIILKGQTIKIDTEDMVDINNVMIKKEGENNGKEGTEDHAIQEDLGQGSLLAEPE